MCSIEWLPTYYHRYLTNDDDDDVYAQFSILTATNDGFPGLCNCWLLYCYCRAAEQVGRKQVYGSRLLGTEMTVSSSLPLERTEGDNTMPRSSSPSPPPPSPSPSLSLSPSQQRNATAGIAPNDSISQCAVQRVPSMERVPTLLSTSVPHLELKHEHEHKRKHRHTDRNAGTDTDNAQLDPLADFMAGSRDGSRVLVRRFERANLRALLAMEMEIAVLEGRLEDAAGKGGDGVEWLERGIGERVREYYKRLLLTKEIMALPHASQKSIEDSRCAFPDHIGQSPWPVPKYRNAEHVSDLCTLIPSTAPDPLTNLFAKFSNSKHTPHFMAFLTAMCAVVFLVGAMVGLYFVENMRTRLGMSAVFTVLFAGTIAALTHTRRHDVFVATAAYAAVLVVFISGNIAAKPEATICVLANGNGNGIANSIANSNPPVLNTATALPSQAPAATVMVTASAIQSVTSYDISSMQTVISTILSTMTSTAGTSTPTAVAKTQGLSTVAKTGVGVGIAIGSIFCLMLLAGILAWVKNWHWGGHGGEFLGLRWKGREGRKRERVVEERRGRRAEKRTGRLKGEGKGNDGDMVRRGKETAVVGSGEVERDMDRDRHAVWV
ncbi:hypothetical protein CC80DRAFT_530359 [Byssothecium circinans]|uniref:DUF6594 domain-containing protein n=1 Tax=Byssothecium circinans TaxID=147558 RepID=A0A6A5UFH4_9PLEO|nr:hypothetical protein CC80DRAFT_530359 [Byssothecium circinans]